MKGNDITALITEYDGFTEVTSAADQIEFLDELIRKLRAPEGCRLIVSHWFEGDECYECGNPAAYFAPFMYGREAPPRPANILCGICAASAAADGEEIRRINPEFNNGPRD